jgi:predicted nucleic acid-binding protein
MEQTENGDCDTGLMLMLDTNCINARQADASVNQLEQWCDAGYVDVVMCETSHRESYADGNAQRFRKATRYAYSMTHAETDEERWQLREIEQALFPSGALTPGQKNDVEIVFNALKYAGILVTRDGGSNRQPGGILGAAAQLKPHGLLVMTPEGAVEFLRKRMRIQKRHR